MAVSVKMTATISDKFSKLVNKKVYEPLLCNLMNASTQVFPGQYELVAEQYSGQCDFIEVGTSTKFDAKLLFSCEHGRLIGSRNHNFTKWLELMLQEEAEYGKDIIVNRGQNVCSTELYRIIEQRLDTVEQDEHAVFFFPYPIVPDGKGFDVLHIATDFLDAIFRELRKQGKIGKRKIYVIYPALDGDIVLRCLNENQREFIRFPEFDEYLAYSFEDGIADT